MLAARLGDVGLEEELVQDAFVEALEHWPSEGLPPNPGGWLATTARRKAIDRLRRDRAGQAKLALLAVTDSPEVSGCTGSCRASPRCWACWHCCCCASRGRPPGSTAGGGWS